MKAYIDGSGKGIKGKSMYGYQIREGERRLLHDWDLTNNQTEWLALITLLIDLKPFTSIEIYSDSELVINQFNGSSKTKDETLRCLKSIAQTLVETKKLEIHLKKIDREKNPFGKYIESLLRKERRKRKKLRERIKREGTSQNFKN